MYQFIYHQLFLVLSVEWLVFNVPVPGSLCMGFAIYVCKVAARYTPNPKTSGRPSKLAEQGGGAVLIEPIKSQFLKMFSNFGDKCPQNGSKNGLTAPRLNSG